MKIGFPGLEKSWKIDKWGKVMEKSWNLRFPRNQNYFSIYIVMFRDWEAIVGPLLFFNRLIHFLYIYYFYLKMVMKFGNFGHEK